MHQFDGDAEFAGDAAGVVVAECLCFPVAVRIDQELGGVVVGFALMAVVHGQDRLVVVDVVTTRPSAYALVSGVIVVVVIDLLWLSADVMRNIR